MDISEVVTDDYEQCIPSTTLSKLRGAFDRDQRIHVIVVAGDDGLKGVVTRKQLLNSHHDPNEKASTVARMPPRVRRTADVREVARLMVENELDLLPVFEGEQFAGVVTARALLGNVLPNLDALTVADVYTEDLLSISADTTLGEVVNQFRVHGISHLPVLEDQRPEGMISIYDLVDFTVRKLDREQGGGEDVSSHHGDAGGADTAHGGWGERSGFAARLLDLPDRDVMTTPAATVESDQSLGEAVAEMLEKGYSSLLVTPPDMEGIVGIVTTTDVLRALTWTEEDRMDVQVFGVDFLDDLTREDIAERIEGIDRKYEEMTVMETNVNVHRHKERVRGSPSCW
ncbi:CBS domain-containing protein [Haloarculaceae archaeon H-GB2-1]|nr:CBS domain-containing protein [Haloarculaceae archaeon H-GB2-1]